MSSVQISGNSGGTGVLNIAAPNTSTNYTLTLPQATGILSIGPQIQPITASVATNAMTITTSALSLDFRSTSLGSGTVTTVSGTPSALVIPSSATLGTVNATQSRIIVLALNNAGTIELAVVNISGGTDLTETGLISTTAISSGSTSASTVYSTTARTSVAYRVIGYIESTQATAGTWATAPSTIQGYGGQALSAMSSLGYGQTWQTVSRSGATTYYNTTGRPIAVQASVTSNTAGDYPIITIGGIAQYWSLMGGAGFIGAVAGIVPPSVSYSITLNVGVITIHGWRELR
jgi:hypothetical protein